MGFAAVLFCETPDIDAVDDATLVGSLVALVGADSYPVVSLSPQRCGPWVLAGSFHSSETVRLTLTTGANTAEFFDAPTSSPAGSSCVSPTISSAAMSAATREYMRSPRRMASAQAVAVRDGSVDVHDVLFGEDPLAGTTIAGSLWWFHLDAADALTAEAAEDPAGLAAAIRSCSRARSDASIQVKQYAAALCCAGRVAPGVTTMCEWSGNRVLLDH